MFYYRATDSESALYKIPRWFLCTWKFEKSLCEESGCSAWYILISQYLVPWLVNSYHPSDLISDFTASGKPSLISPSKTSSYFWVFTQCSRRCDTCFTYIVSCSPFTIFWSWLLFSFYLWENGGTVILITSTRSVISGITRIQTQAVGYRVCASLHPATSPPMRPEPTFVTLSDFTS